MVITRYAAQRFSGLEADVNNLPIDPDLLGAIFNSTDTLKFFIFDGTTWNESAGGGGITGLEPNSTILEYTTDILDYTTPSSATATSGGNPVDITGLKVYYKFDAASGNVINVAGTEVLSPDSIPTADIVPTGGTPTYSQAGIIGTSVAWTQPIEWTASGTVVTDWNFVHQNGSKFTFAGWIKIDSLAQLNRICGTQQGTGSEAGFHIIVNTTSGTISFLNGLFNADIINIASVTTTFPDDAGAAFHFLVLTFDDDTNNVSFSIDNSAPENISVTNLTNTSNATRVLGVGNDSVTPSFIGNMDEVSLWSRALSTAEISILYNGGAGKVLESSIQNAIDGNTTTFWQSNAGINESITLDMGSVLNNFALAYFIDKTASGLTETQFQVIDDTTGIVLRTLNFTELTDQAFNFIRFNGVNTQFIKIEGSSGSSLVMAANELAVQIEPDPPLTTLHGQFTINPTDATLPLSGGDPTTSVINDPVTNSMTLVSAGTQGDPPTDGMVMWNEILDANNSVSRSKMKIDGSIKEVRWF